MLTLVERKNVLVTLLFFMLLSGLTVRADKPITNPKFLWNAKKEIVVRVSSARVVIADYPLIRKDFAEVAGMTNEQIDLWLTENVAFISRVQAGQTLVNSEIYTGSELREAYRPQEYGRGHVFVTKGKRLIDAKGTGSEDPTLDSHSNGLASLGEMIREFVFEKLVKRIFIHAGWFDTVGTYAVMDYGFDIKTEDGRLVRAGAVFRQAHGREHSENVAVLPTEASMLSNYLQRKIESLLRTYGVTSALRSGEVERINLQGSQNGAVVDFGHFLVKRFFSRKVFETYDEVGERPGGLLWSPKDLGFIQPDPAFQIPYSLWGSEESGREDPKYDNLFIWAHRLAESIALGKADASDVDRQYHTMLDPIFEKLSEPKKPVRILNFCSQLFQPRH